MKNATVTITFDAEKLGAVKQYMGKKDADMQAELDEAMQKLYEKFVPAPVREYIESKDGSQDGEPEVRPKRSARSSATREDDTEGNQD